MCAKFEVDVVKNDRLLPFKCQKHSSCCLFPENSEFLTILKILSIFEAFTKCSRVIFAQLMKNTLNAGMTLTGHEVTKILGEYLKAFHGYGPCRSIGFVSIEAAIWTANLMTSNGKHINYELTCDVLFYLQIKLCRVFWKFK